MEKNLRKPVDTYVLYVNSASKSDIYQIKLVEYFLHQQYHDTKQWMF